MSGYKTLREASCTPIPGRPVRPTSHTLHYRCTSLRRCPEGPTPTTFPRSAAGWRRRHTPMVPALGHRRLTVPSLWCNQDMYLHIPQQRGSEPCNPIYNVTSTKCSLAPAPHQTMGGLVPRAASGNASPPDAVRVIHSWESWVITWPPLPQGHLRCTGGVTSSGTRGAPLEGADASGDGNGGCQAGPQPQEPCQDHTLGTAQTCRNISQPHINPSCTPAAISPSVPPPPMGTAAVGGCSHRGCFCTKPARFPR